MSRASVIARGRVFQEESFSDVIAAGREVETVDEDTGATVRVMYAVYSGPALVKYPTLTSSSRESGDQQYESTDIVVKVPIDAPILPGGTIIRPTASGFDASLVGRRYRVKAWPQSGQVTSHRYPVEEIS
jgi:hypothetical protein